MQKKADEVFKMIEKIINKKINKDNARKCV